MPGDEVVGHRAGKAPAPAVAVEAEQVVAIGVGFADPQFADHAAVGQRLVHFGSPYGHVVPVCRSFWAPRH